jgi:hypothetical protein
MSFQTGCRIGGNGKRTGYRPRHALRCVFWMSHPKLSKPVTGCRECQPERVRIAWQRDPD